MDKDSVVKLLHYRTMEEGESLTALIKAAKNGQRDLVHALLDISNVDIEQTGTVKVDHETINGATALWTAVCYGHFDIVKLLIKFAANVNHTTDSGSTPLRVACYNGSLTFVDYLMEHDADCNIANSNQQTCLMLACQKRYYDIVQYLVEKGADTKCKDKIGSTALHFSAALGQFAITKLLIEKGSMMTKDNKGLTPLMVAASNGKVEIVEYLSPLSECSREENIDVLELLGASFLLKTDFDILKVYQYFEQAMQERYKDPDEIIFKRHASQALTIINIVECKTLDDLQKN